MFAANYGGEFDERGEEAFDRYWRTRSTEPGGLLILDREEAVSAASWLGLRGFPAEWVVVG